MLSDDDDLGIQSLAVRGQSPSSLHSVNYFLSLETREMEEGQDGKG